MRFSLAFVIISGLAVAMNYVPQTESSASTNTRVFVSKIRGDQIVRTPAAADVHPGSGGTYRITIGIECVQETRFIGVSVRLKSPQRVFLYEK
jgi:hypothetical protein